MVAAEQGRTSPEFLAIHLALGDALLRTSLQDAADTYVEVRRYLGMLSERVPRMAVMPFSLLTHDARRPYYIAGC